MRRSWVPLTGLAFVMALTPLRALAQPTKDAPPATEPAPGDTAEPPPSDAPAPRMPRMDELPTSRSLMMKTLAPQPDGLQPEQVAKDTAATSPDAAVVTAEMRAAAAKVDQAVAAYFPRARLAATYTRQSEVINSFDIGIDLPPGVDTSFPVILNQYSLTASLEIPLSDYLLRLTQGYATVSLDVDAKRFELEATQLQARMSGKVAYFNWIRAKGQRSVAGLAVLQANRHVHDAELALSAEVISKADLLRLKAQLAQASHLARAATNFERLAEVQLRNVAHYPADKKLAIGIDIMTPPRNVDKLDLAALQQRALSNRLELRALATAKQSLKEVSSLTRAGYYPRLDAFGNAMYANPNPRIFPQDEKWDFTWDVGLRLSWTINDTFTTIGAAAEIDAQVAAVDQRLNALKDGIRMAVAAAYFDVQTAHSAIIAARLREDAALQGLDVRRRLFRGGRASATDIVDSDAELTQSRLQHVNALVDANVALARLEHAIGGPLTAPYSGKPGAPATPAPTTTK